MTTQFAPAPVEFAPQTDGRFWPGFSVGVCAATIVAGVIATGSLLADRMPATSVFEMNGTLTVVGGVTDRAAPGFECVGDRGFDDIAPGASVSVSDGSGAVLGTGLLTRSVREGNFCTFFFAVPDVPHGVSGYAVQITHRGSVSFDETEAETGVHLTLGR